CVPDAGVSCSIGVLPPGGGTPCVASGDAGTVGPPCSMIRFMSSALFFRSCDLWPCWTATVATRRKRNAPAGKRSAPGQLLRAFIVYPNRVRGDCHATRATRMGIEALIAYRRRHHAHRNPIWVFDM